MISWQRFRVGHIQRSTENTTFLHHCRQCRRIYNPAPCTIHQHRRWLHQPQLTQSNEVTRLGGQRAVECYKVGALKKIREITPFDPKILLGFFVLASIVVDYLHVKATSTFGDLVADASTANDPNHGSVHLLAEVVVEAQCGELGRPCECVRLNNISSSREKKSEGLVRGGSVHRAWGVPYFDTASRTVPHVDMIDPHAVV
mmetsp:Transcript_16846/g.40011  ORF Transcript_16846/g.40011 Transcript_16846/m.40011 type:complete len:201 (+) Transcript_16846:1335-1937(+)